MIPKPVPYRPPEEVVADLIDWYRMAEDRLPTIKELIRDAKLSRRTAVRWRLIVLRRQSVTRTTGKRENHQ